MIDFGISTGWVVGTMFAMLATFLIHWMPLEFAFGESVSRAVACGLFATALLSGAVVWAVVDWQLLQLPIVVVFYGGPIVSMRAGLWIDRWLGKRRTRRLQQEDKANVAT